MLTVGMLLRARHEDVARLARALGLKVADGERHGLLCQRVIVAIWRQR